MRPLSILLILIPLAISQIFAQPFQFNGPGDWTEEAKWTPSYPGLVVDPGEEVTINGECTLTFGNHLENYGTITNEGSFILDYNYSNYGSLYNNGTLNMNFNFYNDGGMFQNDGDVYDNAGWGNDINGVIINNGNYYLTSTLSIYTGSLTNHGLFDSYGGDISNYATIENHQTMINFGPFYQGADAAFTNAKGAIFTNYSSFTSYGNFENYGLLLNLGTYGVPFFTNYNFLLNDGEITNEGRLRNLTQTSVGRDAQFDNNGYVYSDYGFYNTGVFNNNPTGIFKNCGYWECDNGVTNNSGVINPGGDADADCVDDCCTSSGTEEIVCNGIDDDCDPNTPDAPDADGDGFTVCEDCDDENDAIYPGAAEVTCNGLDDDCDPNTPDAPDADGDGFTVCEDCDDENDAVYPGAAEVTCNGLDDDCDPNTPDAPDNDGDGFTICEDCDDENDAIYPGASEVTCNGIDDDCDPNTLDAPDADGDGFTVCEDCDDENDAIYPGASEVTCNGLDDDCDPNTLDAPDNDGDGFTICEDCDDADPTIYPGAQEICDNLDNDCDGQVDEDFYVDISCGKIGEKILVCHIPNGNPFNAHTICISPSALEAHLAHGDQIGPCGSTPCNPDVQTVELRFSQSSITNDLLAVYPNPTSGGIYIVYPQGIIKEIAVFNLQGVMVIQNKASDSLGNKFYLSEFEALKSGSYILNVISEEGERFNHRIIKME